MKLSLKMNLFLLFLPFLFFGLHLFVYHNDQGVFDGFLLVSPVETPLDIENLSLKEEIYPSYWNPFQKMRYEYTEKGGNEVIIIEEHPRFSVLNTDMKIILGDPEKYYDAQKDGMSYKGFATNEYPNVLFFIVQYAIVISFLIVVFERFIQKKKITQQ